MYRAYAALKDWYNLAIWLLYTDINSLIIHVISHDLYNNSLEMLVLRKLMVLGELSANHRNGISDPYSLNKSILGKLNLVWHVI